MAEENVNAEAVDAVEEPVAADQEEQPVEQENGADDAQVEEPAADEPAVEAVDDAAEPAADAEEKKDADVAMFASDEIVPDVVDAEPQQTLSVKWTVGDDSFSLDKFGQERTPTQCQNQPVLSVAEGVSADKQYTVILTDPDAASRAKPEYREWVHLVVVNVPVVKQDDDTFLFDTASGETVIEYIGSAPPPDTGLHRYVFLVYEQTKAITVSECGQEKLIAKGGNGDGRPKFSAKTFASKNGLDTLVAGNFYQAQYDDFVPEIYASLKPVEEEKVEEAKEEAPKEEPKKKKGKKKRKKKVKAAADGDGAVARTYWDKISVKNQKALNWYVLKLAGKVGTTTDLEFVSEGKGGAKELVEFFANEDQKKSILFALLQCVTTDDAKSVRSKFVYFRFIGSGVKTITKAKMTTYLGKIDDHFPCKHLTMNINEKCAEDMEPKKMATELLRIGGAHKPDTISFGAGQDVDVDSL